jgi:hypothetical protein
MKTSWDDLHNPKPKEKRKPQKRKTVKQYRFTLKELIDDEQEKKKQ